MLEEINASKILIRITNNADMEDIQVIYDYNVLKGLASFDKTPPDVAELTRRCEVLAAQETPIG